MFIVNINRDLDRQLLVLILKSDLSPKIIWNKGLEYCMDFPEYEDYSKAKDIQISLSERFPGIYIPVI